MSNPLILHGTQIALPKARPVPHPMPCIAEGTAESSQPSDSTNTQTQGGKPLGGPLGGSHGGLGPQQALLHQSHAKNSPPPFRSALNTALLSAAQPQPARTLARAGNVVGESDDCGKDRTLNADERLKRLKLRMQHTIQAYSGSPSCAASARRYTRTHSLTAASPHAAYSRTNSSPVRPSRGVVHGASRRATDDSSSCHSSSSCSSAANPSSTEGVAKGVVKGLVSSRASDERQLMQTTSMPTQRGIPQVCPPYLHWPVQHSLVVLGTAACLSSLCRTYTSTVDLLRATCMLAHITQHACCRLPHIQWLECESKSIVHLHKQMGVSGLMACRFR